MKRVNAPVTGLLILSGMLGSCGGSSSSVGTSDSTALNRKTDTGNVQLTKVWETDTSLRTPESVLWDSAKEMYYVSNIDGDAGERDNNGFISELNKDGKVTRLHWIDGMDAPKGLGLYKDKLYIADIDSLVIADVNTSKISKLFVPGSVFLNDVAVDNSNGNIYISDTRQGKIFLYNNGKITEYLSSPEVKNANGLLVWKDKLWIDAADGIYNYDFNEKKFTLHCPSVKGGDGLVAIDDSDLMASRWAGEIYYVYADGSSKKLLDTKEANSYTADIYYSKESNQLLVPTFKGNRVVAYTLQR